MAYLKVVPLLIVCLLFGVWADDPNCHYQGYVCSADCLALYFCVGADEIPIHIEDCTPDALCNSINGTCSEGSEGLSCFAEHEFACKSTKGLFPDLYDCTAYYNCTGSPPKPTRLECPKTAAYDVTTKQCDLPSTSHVCDRNGRIPGCSKVGDTGVVDGDSNLYYVCVRDGVNLYIYPELHKCSGTGTYDPNTFTCSSS